jgi:hypothetical protein
MIPLHSQIADTLGRTSGNQIVVASGHLFYLAHGNMGNFPNRAKGRTSTAILKRTELSSRPTTAKPFSFGSCFAISGDQTQRSFSGRCAALNFMTAVEASRWSQDGVSAAFVNSG